MEETNPMLQHSSLYEENTFSQSNVKFVYNMTPTSPALVQKIGIPNAVHYSPFDQQVKVQRISNMRALICISCKSYFNSQCIMDNQNWVCSICKGSNKMDNNIPQICRSSQTYEIELSKNPIKNPNEQIYLFVIDLCVPDKQLSQIKESIIQFVQMKKSSDINQFTEIKLGLITFSKFVYLYELSSDINTVLSFNPKKAYQPHQFSQLLGLPFATRHDPTFNQRYHLLAKKFFTKLSNQQSAQKFIKKIIRLRAQDQVSFIQGKRTRALRASGQAINLSLSIAEGIPFQTRIVTCLGGPCTHGLGKTISNDFNQQSRSIKQVDNEPDELAFFDNARKFYAQLKQKIMEKGTIIDFFMFSLEQMGIAEMYELIRVSGGLLVLGEQFSGQNLIFKNSFRKAYIQIFETEGSSSYSLCDLSGSESLLNVSCSKSIQLNGAVGQCHPLKNIPKNLNKNYSDEKVLGFGKTNSWYLGSVDLYRSITIIYESLQQKGIENSYTLQFKTFYTDCYGRRIVRVTTVSRPWETDMNAVIQYFDEEAATLVLVRWFIYREMYDIKKNNKHWIDKVLVNWAQHFGNYERGDTASFTLAQNVKHFPQFLYHFRRGSIFKRTGISLDQLYYQMHALTRYNLNQCMTMIQPALLSYSVENLEPKAVKLDEKQMKEAVILLLDTFMNVVLWYGESIDYWHQQKYYQKQEYQHIKNLIESPQEDINYLMNNRFPSPGFYQTSSNHSKERFLKSKLSPKDYSDNENMLTQQSSLQKFLIGMIEAAVKSRKK